MSYESRWKVSLCCDSVLGVVVVVGWEVFEEEEEEGEGKVAMVTRELYDEHHGKSIRLGKSHSPKADEIEFAATYPAEDRVPAIWSTSPS